MVWSNFETPQSYIVENRNQPINLNTGCVTNVTFQEVGCNCGIFKQFLQNILNEFRSICGSKDVAIKFCEKQLKIEQPLTFEVPRMWQ